jgi:hypothetical protein
MVTFLRRRLYNRSRDESPYFLVHGERPSIKELIIPGSIMTIVKPNKNSLPRFSKDRSSIGYICGFGNNCQVSLYWTPQHPLSLQRSYHSIIEDTATFAILDPQVFTTAIDTTNTTDIPQVDKPLPVVPDTIHDSLAQTNDLSFVKSGFPDQDVTAITLTLPPDGKLGIELSDDVLYNLPVINKCHPDSFWYKNVPVAFRRNVFVLGFDNDQPITSKFLQHCISTTQCSTNRKVTFDLVQRGQKDQSTSLYISCAIFDNFPTFIKNKPSISNASNIPDSHSQFIISPVKPAQPEKSIFDLLKGAHRLHWKAAAWIQFQKNKRVGVFTLPFPAFDLPPDARIFRTLLVPEYKPTEIPTVWECRVRECVVGTQQKQYLDFEVSYAPTLDGMTFCIFIAWASSKGYIIVIIDVKNAFQNTIAPPDKRLYVTTPPTYLEWLRQSEDFQYDRNQKYYRVMINSSQGTQDAGTQWYLLVVNIFTDFGFMQSTVDKSLFIKTLVDFDPPEYLAVGVQTDDFCTAAPNSAIIHHFIKIFGAILCSISQNRRCVKVQWYTHHSI